MQQQALQTEFGTLETVHLWYYPDGLSVVISGTATVNRVEYSVRFEAKKGKEGWSQGNLMMDRKDRKDAAFPFNAREKFGNHLLALIPLLATPQATTEALKEYLRERIDTLNTEITRAQTVIDENSVQVKKLTTELLALSVGGEKA